MQLEVGHLRCSQPLILSMLDWYILCDLRHGIGSTRCSLDLAVCDLRNSREGSRSVDLAISNLSCLTLRHSSSADIVRDNAEAVIDRACASGWCGCTGGNVCSDSLTHCKEWIGLSHNGEGEDEVRKHGSKSIQKISIIFFLPILELCLH